MIPSGVEEKIGMLGPRGGGKGRRVCVGGGAYTLEQHVGKGGGTWRSRRDES